LDYNEISGVRNIIKNSTNMSEIYLSQFRRLLCQNHLSIKDRKSGRIWNHFPTWIEVSISYLN